MLGVRRKKDHYQLVFLASQFEMLVALPDNLRKLLEEMDGDSPVIKRLFPAASSDAEVNEEFQELAAQDIRNRKLENLTIFEQTLNGARREKVVKLVFVKITAEEFEFWVGFLNDMRLLLGTDIGITDDYWDAEAAYEETGDERIVLYGYLSYLQGKLLAIHMDLKDEDWSDLV